MGALPDRTQSFGNIVQSPQGPAWHDQPFRSLTGLLVPARIQVFNAIDYLVQCLAKKVHCTVPLIRPRSIDLITIERTVIVFLMFHPNKFDGTAKAIATFPKNLLP
jgi:hypothetical protein